LLGTIRHGRASSAKVTATKVSTISIKATPTFQPIALPDEASSVAAISSHGDGTLPSQTPALGGEVGPLE
jgi:hypothetical protein